MASASARFRMSSRKAAGSAQSGGTRTRSAWLADAGRQGVEVRRRRPDTRRPEDPSRGRRTHTSGALDPEAYLFGGTRPRGGWRSAVVLLRTYARYLPQPNVSSPAPIQAPAGTLAAPGSG
jgi:hypothetical protein